MARLPFTHRRALREAAIGNVPGHLITITDPGSAVSEDYRILRANLPYTLVDARPRAIVVTSPNILEGKSTTCANLGVVLAQAKKSTLVMDCDFRKPALHKIFGLRNLQGVVSALAGDCSLQEAWQEPLPGLKVVSAGPIPPNPAELLDSKRFTNLLDWVRREFDYVLIDAPPVRPISDTLVLAAMGDGVLLVLDSQNTAKAALRQTMHSLRAVRANVLGTVMNNVEASINDNRYRSYGFE
jgi:capsular exopolysaccharide synthesis family protein